MTSHKIGACIFDAYGTLFDAHSAVGRLKKSVGERAGELAGLAYETTRVHVGFGV
ncbi:MAG: hypothetical protein V3V11_03880 [Vicinamibacteria bacterium]